MSLLSKTHFFIGKGGAGKSTLATSFAQMLSLKKEGPILLLDIQGSGRSLKLGGLESPSFEAQPMPQISQVWGARILPFASFKEYFSLRLAFNDFDSSLAHATAGMRERFVNLVLDNKVVSAFVDVCPGLEPAVLLGKIHWEASRGCIPNTKERWRHVIIDAPATGHGLSLFKSTSALAEVFLKGPIFNQVNQIMKDLRNSEYTKFYTVTLPEELPLQETLELQRDLETLEFRVEHTFINRTLTSLAPLDSKLAESLTADWRREIDFEYDARQNSESLVKDFLSKIKSRFQYIPEVFAPNMEQQILAIAQAIEVTL